MKDSVHNSHIWFKTLPGNHRNIANNAIIRARRVMALGKISALHVV
jgi:hypothetical protein